MRQDKNASVWKFVHDDLLPKLKNLENQPGANARQKVISEIMSSVGRSRILILKRIFGIALDKVHEISSVTVDDLRMFSRCSLVYEGLLLKMGEKGNDGGQFFTPREVIRAMVRVVDPKIKQTVYDPGCGTGGFLAQAYEYMKAKAGEDITGPQLETLKRRTFYGREKDNAVYPIALANLVLHGIDEPHIWHGNSLSGVASYDGLFQGAPQFYDVVLMNPPFGGKEGKEAQIPYEYKTGATQVLFLQNVLKSMRKGSHCGIVLDEGVLFRVDGEAFVKTKRKLLEECNVYCIVSLPGGVFTSAGAGVKTNLVFFTKGKPTEKIWYYDLSDVKVGKKTPITLRHFDEFFQLLPKRGDSKQSWTLEFTARLQTALDEARPHREKAAELSAQAKRLEDELRDQPEEKVAASKLAALEEELKTIQRAARESLAKGETIENAAYDLKAVNPNRVTKEDKRTPTQLPNLSSAKGQEADKALTRLRELVA